jgi:hypothetical protein
MVSCDFTLWMDQADMRESRYSKSQQTIMLFIAFAE